MNTLYLDPNQYKIKKVKKSYYKPRDKFNGKLTSSELGRQTGYSRSNINILKTELMPFVIENINGRLIYGQEAVEFLNKRRKVNVKN